MTDEQIAKAARYNAKQCPESWEPSDLPWPFWLYGAGSDELAIHTAVHQMYEGLPVDGMLGPNTLNSIVMTFSLEETEAEELPAGLAGATVLRAASQVGVREVGNNSGPEVDKYIKYGGGSLSADPAWCQFFAYWCSGKAAEGLGKDTSSPKTGGVVDCWLKSKYTESEQIWPYEVQRGEKTVQPGDQMCRVRNSKPGDVEKVRMGQRVPGHTGIVERVEGSKIYTIEGNTNAAGSREGDGVYRKSISLDSDVLIGFIRHVAK